MGTIIDRYIIREIAIPFLASLFVMTFVLLLGKILQLMELLVNKGVALRDIASLIVLLMPHFLIYTIPIALLIAILAGLGRMSTENEITVLHGAGISLYRLFIPVAALSCAAFLLSLSLSLFFVPYSNHATKNLLFAIIRYNVSVGLKEKVFNDAFKGLLLYANTIPAGGTHMEGVMISDTRLAREPNTIFAERASLLSDDTSRRVVVRLENGSIHTMDLKRHTYRKIDFSAYDITLDLESGFTGAYGSRTKDSVEMTVAELRAAIKTSGLADNERREMIIEFHKKFTFPATCLIFGLLGLPLGTTVRKSARAKGVTISFAIVLCYYLLQIAMEGLTETGKIAPGIGAWFTPLLFTLAGMCLLRMRAGEQGVNIEKIVPWLKRSD